MLKDGVKLWDRQTPSWEISERYGEPNKMICAPNDEAFILTIQSRRARLEGKDGVVTSMIIRGGDFFEKIDAFPEQMILWNHMKNSTHYTTRTNDYGKSMWREMAYLFPEKDSTEHKPGITAWIDTLLEDEGIGLIDFKKHITYREVSVKYGSMSSCIADLCNDYIVMPTIIFNNKTHSWLYSISSQINKCESVSQYIGIFVENLEKASGNEKKGKGEAQKYQNLYFSKIDMPFRSWLVSIDKNPDDRYQKENDWQKISKEVATEIANEALNKYGMKAYIGHYYKEKGKNNKPVFYSAASCINMFEAELNKIYPKEV